MKLKNWLSIAGIFNIVLGIFMFLISRITIVPVVFLVLSGFFYRTFFDNEDAYQKRVWLLILGIINLFFNFVSGIIVLEVFGLFKEEKQSISNEIRKKSKINSLLQLGVVLVILSGIMIATNQSLEIPNILKVIGLLLLSVIFFFLSYMSKNYLKLMSSFKSYFILGISFIIFSFIGLYYYNLLGSLSIDSINYLYFYPLLFLLISVASMITAKVIDVKYLYNIGIGFVFVGLFSWFNALELDIVINLLIITLSASLINFVYNPSCIVTKMVRDTAYILSLILVPINLVIMLVNNFEVASCILTIVNTLNIFHLLVIKKNNLLSIIFIPTLILNSLLLVFKQPELLEIKVVIFQVMMIVFYNLIRMIKLYDINKLIEKVSKVLFNIVFIITSISSLYIDSTAALFVSALSFLQNIVGIIRGEKEELYLEPIKSLLFAVSLIALLNTKFELDFIFNLFIVEIIQLFLYLFIKNDLIKKIHYYLYFGFIGLIALASTECSNLFLALIALVSSLIPILVIMLKKDKSLFILLFSISTLLIINTNDIFVEINYLNYLFVILLLLFYGYLFKSEKTNRYIALFGVAGNAFIFINVVDLKNYLYSSLNILLFVYLALLIASLFDDNKSKDIFLGISLGVICLFNIFTPYTMVSILVSIITLLMVIFGFIKDFKILKVSGIILFILNLIYLLRDLWSTIPFAIYLLVIGLTLIGIVIFKEMKENKD